MIIFADYAFNSVNFAMMKKSIVLIILSLSCLLLGAADKSAPEKYIEKYASMAVEEMYRSGVPASITLAQGMLESRNGLSVLAVKGNNHFGIKCHNSWYGGRIYHDDDRRKECFRKYKSPEESFRDHSDFLRYRDRYKFLFDLRTTDYKGWAYGLKKAGYATDPAYPRKLINLIETYKLYQYDTKSASWSDSKYSKHKPKKNRRHKTHRNKADKPASDVIPQSPHEIEQAVPLEDSKREVFRFDLSRRMYSQNGVAFVYAVEGETYESIAYSYNLFAGEILRFNDLSKSRALSPGEVVYVQAKKKHSKDGLDKYVCEGGESPRDIAQRFAIRLSSLCKMNGIHPDTELREGDVLKLTK